MARFPPGALAPLRAAAGAGGGADVSGRGADPRLGDRPASGAGAGDAAGRQSQPVLPVCADALARHDRGDRRAVRSRRRRFPARLADPAGPGSGGADDRRRRQRRCALAAAGRRVGQRHGGVRCVLGAGHLSGAAGRGAAGRGTRLRAGGGAGRLDRPGGGAPCRSYAGPGDGRVHFRGGGRAGCFAPGRSARC
jgi:hypothetical protein